jgi:mitogen-activated protein kinase 15
MPRYRAPEILLGSTSYTFGVDMWGAGCILAELLAGRPLFPGSSTLNQLDRVLEVTGRPSPAELAACCSPYAAALLDSLPGARAHAPRPLRDRFPGAPPEALDLLRRLLCFSPAQRLSAAEALRHPYVASFSGTGGGEPCCDRRISLPIDDNLRMTTEEYRDRLYGEVVRRKRELRRRSKEREAAASVPPPSAAKPMPEKHVTPAEAPAASTPPPSQNASGARTRASGGAAAAAASAVAKGGGRASGGFGYAAQAQAAAAPRRASFGGRYT